jgi:hypothetical protein
MLANIFDFSRLDYIDCGVRYPQVAEINIADPRKSTVIPTAQFKYMLCKCTHSWFVTIFSFID